MFYVELIREEVKFDLLNPYLIKLDHCDLVSNTIRVVHGRMKIL